MANNYDWTNFAVFDGTCRLTRLSLRSTTADFFDWIDTLRGLGPPDRLFGIPANRIQDVTRLLNAFFPHGQEPVAVRFKTEDGNPTYLADPITVTFGGGTIKINDGPSALGYIFSIAGRPAPANGQPALPQKSFSNFGLPLLALYARWIRLAFGSLRLHNQTNKLVPVMSCIMYTTDANNDFYYLLGSTYVSDGSDAVRWNDNFQKRKMMNNWRFDHVLDTQEGFRSTNPSRALRLPPISPTVRESASWAYLRMLCGVSIARPGRTLYRDPAQNPPNTAANFQAAPSTIAADAFFTAVQQAFQTAWTTAFPGTEIKPFPRGELSDAVSFPPGVAPIMQDLYQALEAIITRRWQGQFTVNDQGVKALFIALMNAYYVPHMFKKKTANSAPDLRFPVDVPGATLLLSPIIEPFWTLWGAQMIKHLDDLYFWVSRGNDDLWEAGPGVSRFGRCAETHPVVGIMPGLTTARVLPGPNSPGTPVRGFAFQSRRFNTPLANTLAGSFRSQTLNNLHSPNNPLYRKPCINCQALLPVMDVPQGPHDYDADLYTVYPGAAGVS